MKLILKILGYERVVFLFVGDGVKKKGLLKFAKNNHINNGYFLPYQSRLNMKYIIDACDLFLVTLDRRAVGSVVLTKSYDGMAAGKPILGIGPENCELYDIVAKEKCGIYKRNGDTFSFVEAI